MTGQRAHPVAATATEPSRVVPASTPKPFCPSCGSPRWVSVSLDGGYTRKAQCVPCGAIHAPVIGPGWRSPRYGDPDAVHPDYQDTPPVTTKENNS